MKKIVSLLFLATFAFAEMSLAQGTGGGASGIKGNGSAQGVAAFRGGPLAATRPTPNNRAAPADNGGKKMVGEVMLAADEKGKNTTTSFPAGTSAIYMMTKNVSGANGDKVRVEWFADDAGKSMAKGKRFYSSDVVLPDTMAHNPNFHVTGPGDKAFPAGKYHVDVSVGGEKFKSAKFTVQ